MTRARFSLTAREMVYPRERPFRITKFRQTEVHVVVVELRDGEGHVGRGEATGDYMQRETAASMLVALEGVAGHLRDGASLKQAMFDLHGSGARNAFDAATWDYRSKCAGVRAWTLAGLNVARPLESTFTIGLEAHEAAAELASKTDHRILKLKVDADHHLDVVRAVRLERPDALIALDANEGWSFDLLNRLEPELVALGVRLIEQPLPIGRDDDLTAYQGRIPLVADESFSNIADLDRVRGRYAYVNIKLDKCGGLTSGLDCAHRIRAAGLKPMVGCMNGSSLANAAGFILGQVCEFVDLDSSIPLTEPWSPPLEFRRGWVQPPCAELWG